MIKRLALAGLASGILSPTILYIAGIWLDVFALFYLYVGPGLVYAICTLLAIGKTSSVWRRLAYLITVTGVYVVAVLLYLQLIEGVTSDRIAVGVVGCLGGGLVVLLTRIITPVKSLFVHGITGVFIGGICAAVVPIDWVPSLPNTWILFPLWQTAIAAYIGKILSIIPMVTSMAPAATSVSDISTVQNLTEQ